jgi:hypothetical protein
MVITPLNELLSENEIVGGANETLDARCDNI